MESIMNMGVKEEKYTFPRLMIFNSGICEMVALFSSDKCATIVNITEGASHKLGDYDDNWTIGSWKDYHGDIVLKS